MRKISLILITTILTLGCSKKDDQSSSLPSVSIVQVTNITLNSATSGGDITDNGGATITSKGVCWSTSSNPDINDSRTNEGSGDGTFVSQLTSLESETTYFLRAYAENSSGISYSEEISFFTEINCSGNIYEGNIYLTTQTEVNNFGINNYCEVTEALTIGSTPIGSTDPVVNLSPLNSIQKVKFLSIQFTQVLEDLDGLENLQVVTERIAIYENLELKNIDGLINVTSPLNDVAIERNEKLETIDGLSSLNSLIELNNRPPTMFVMNNDLLNNIDGLNGINSMEGGALFIWYNPLITNIDALSNIPGTIDELAFFGNDSLSNLDGLSHLETITGTLSIVVSSSLTNLSGLNNLTSVGGGLTLSFVPLTTLEGLGNLNSIQGGLKLTQNSFLTNIDALTSLTTIGSLEIEQIGATNLDGFINLVTIDGDLEITRNNFLADFCGLEAAIINGIGGEYIVNLNAYNPTIQDIIDGNCSL
jgi:hypothetical protein